MKRRVRTIAVAKDSPLRFEEVEPGQYVVAAKGALPWERFGASVTLAPGEHIRLPIAIEPFDLRVRVEDGEMSLPHAQVLLKNRDLQWDGSFETGGDGEATLHLWQGGRLQCTVTAEGQVPYIDRREIEAGDETWVIAVPRYELRGIVVDATSGKPIAGAALALQMHSEEKYTLAVKGTTDEQGAFRFAPAVYGSHVLHAAARGYPPVELPVELHAPDMQRSITVKLTRGDPFQIHVVDERGRPINGALVIEYAGLHRGGQTVTDAEGRAEILLTEKEQKIVYVIPRDGSFAIAPAVPGIGETRVVVRDGVGRIELRALSKNDAPIPDVAVVTRYNGTVLPLDVVNAIANMHGWRPRADADGRIIYNHVPVGTYEFWPVGSNAEFLALSAGVGPRAPVTMAVGPGNNIAVMTFARVGESR